MSKKKKMHNEVKKSAKTNYWMISTIVLGIFLVISLATRGSGNTGSVEGVIEQLNTLNSKQQPPEMKAAISSAITTLVSAQSVSGNDRQEAVLGEGQILIEEFSDFECPFCGRFYSNTYQQLKEDYVDTGKVVWEFKHFPLSFHQNAQKAAEASECARDQGMFWQYHDVLFENQNSLSVSSLKRYASDMGLDTDQFNTCLDSGSKASLVQSDFREGQSRGVSGTPTLFINGQKIVGAQPTDTFIAAIEQELAKV